MAIQKEQKNQSIVLLPKPKEGFNPGEINQYWLHSNKICDANKIDKSSIFSPEYVQVITSSFNLTVVGDQMIINPTSTENFEFVATDVMPKIISNLEKGEFLAFGLNFTWYIKDDNLSIEEFSTKYFSNSNNPGQAFFSKPDAQHGDYVSVDVADNLRLKLDIKPVNIVNSPTGWDKSMQFTFNFHSDLQVKDKKAFLLSILKDFEKWRIMTMKLLDLYK